MQTLTELIKESLEGKLSDQIRASIETEDNDMNEATQETLKLDKKFSDKVFKVGIPEWKTKEVDQFFKKYFNIGINELSKLNYTTISNAAFSRKIKHDSSVDSCHWSPTGGSDRVDLDIWQHYPSNTLFGSFHIPGNYKKVVILGPMKELKESLEGKLSDQIRASLEVEDDEINEGLSKYINSKEYMIYTFDINSSDIPNTFITCIKKFLGQQKLFATDEDNVCVKYVNSHGSTVYVPLSSIKKYVKRFVDGKQFLYIYKWEDKYFAKYYDADNYLRYIFT